MNWIFDKNAKLNAKMLTFVKEQGGSAVIETKAGLKFLFLSNGNIIGNAKLKQDDDNGISYNLRAEYKDAEEFFSVNRLKNFEDTEKITEGDLWLRYLHGDGFVSVDINVVGAEVCFRVLKGSTMVYSKDLGYYDELGSALSMTIHFEIYIAEKMHRFKVMSRKLESLLSGSGEYKGLLEAVKLLRGGA